MTTFSMSRTSWWVSLRLVVVLALLLGLIYPLAVTLVGGALFPHQATGSLLYDREGKVVGSALVGQGFQEARYFHGRPSAADYAADGVSGSNLAPSNPQLRQRALDEAQRLQTRDGLVAGQIPVDLLAASGSGIDPHISLEAAQAQRARVAQQRGLSESEVDSMISAAIDDGGWLGKPLVNVLRLNLALDAR
ncbi:potassium-transporting ATPase subunit KdpC [Halomonas binhaiensis]|uniref:Potassium-transporting ATPase KdpC subunit n=1 Tax=Halomonas binhaiensis TaxID=2562282 RepID=A0A856QKC6_9GAMM|nr:potassium-transporting ATPase subunit KdpC [Halomonas binhaiensis]QEM80358.2 potassium-transporting ATPase subunit KdpC [Halomonas binhaiensis]